MLNRREVLRGGISGAAAIGVAAGTDFIVNDLKLIEALPDLPDLQNPDDKIAESKAVFDGQASWRERAALPVNGHEHLTRAEYAAEFFRNAQTVMPAIKGNHSSGARIQQWFDTFVEMPESIRENLSEIVAGQIAQESKFDNNAFNRSSRARTLWQIIPDVYRIEANYDEAAMASMETSTQVAFYNYERIYTVLKNGVQLGNIDVHGLDFERFKNHFGFTQPQWENFLTLVMVNAYNTGERRMLEILHWFQGEYSADDWAQLENKTELGLFSLMADSARSNRAFRRYDRHSSEYVFKSLGAQASLDGGGLDYTQTGASLVSRATTWVKDQLYETGIPVATGTVAGLATRNALATSERFPKPKKTVKTLAGKATRDLGRFTRTAIEQIGLSAKATYRGSAESAKRHAIPNQTMTRREALTKLGGATAASVAGLIGARNSDLFADVDFNFPDNLISAPSLEGSFSAAEVPAEMARLNARGIFLSSSTQGFSENVLVDGPGRTALVSMRKDVLATIEQLLNDLDLLDKTTDQNSNNAVVITGMAEDAGHSPRVHGHGPGFAVDYRHHTAENIEAKLIDHTEVVNATTRNLHPEHRLLQSGLVIGEKIFRYNSKYFLFGVQHSGKNYVCYFDAESSHRHMEMIPWEDYNVESQEAFVEAAELPRSMRGIWREQVQNYVEEQVDLPETLQKAWHQEVRDYLRQFID